MRAGKRKNSDGATKTKRRVGLPLQEGESVAFEVRPSRAANLHKYVYTLGLYGLWRRRDTAAVTNGRVLFGRGIVNREERSIPMREVEGARFVRRGVNSYAQVSVNDRGEKRTERVGPMSARAARQFVAEILKRQ